MTVNLSYYKRNCLSQFFVIFLVLIPSLVFGKGVDNTFLSLDRSLQSETDHRITSIGGFGIRGGKIGHINLSYLETEINSDETWALDFGADAAFDAGLTFFVGAGFLLRYHNPKRDVVATIYPEIGIAAFITKKFGMNIIGKRYFNFYGQVETVVSVGFLFSIR